MTAFSDLRHTPAHGEPSPLSSSWSWTSADGNVTWVFGMRWLPTLGSRSQRLLFANLRQQGVSWCVSHGKSTQLIGVTDLAIHHKSAQRTASAAAAFAQSKPIGVHAFCLHVVDRGVWFVACHDGQLLSQTDCWYSSVAQATQHIETLRRRFAALETVLITWAAPSDEPLPSELMFLSEATIKAIRFRRLPANPQRMRLTLFLVVAVLCGIWLWRDSTFDVTQQNNVPMVTEPSLPIVRIHDVAELVTLVDSWQVLPITVKGWVLDRIECQVTDRFADCRAIYSRESLKANNDGLTQDVPQGWRFAAISLDQAELRRTYRLETKQLDSKSTWSIGDGLTQLQRMSSQVASLTVGSPSLISKHDRSSVAKRLLMVRMAMRQTQHLAQWALPVNWQRVGLNISRSAPVSDRYGYLMLDLKGEIYAQN